MSDAKFSTTGDAKRITVKINDYKGNKHVLIQKEYKKYGSEEWHPGKAVSVAFDVWMNFQGVVHRMTDELLEQHLIAPEEPR